MICAFLADSGVILGAKKWRRSVLILTQKEIIARARQVIMMCHIGL